MLKFLFDGIEVDNPKNWEDISIVREFNEETRLYLVSIDTEFTFADSGYQHLDNHFNTQGFCTPVSVVIKLFCSNVWETIHTGNIFIADCDFDLDKCFVDTVISDNSYNALVKNNLKQKLVLNSGFTVDGNANTILTTSISSRLCVRVEDAFKYLLYGVTEGQVGFTSTLFESGGDFDGLCLVLGQELRTQDGKNTPELNLETLIREINKKLNIAGAIESDVNGNPVLRIEYYDYFLQSGVVTTFENVPDVHRTFDQDRLYSVLQIGSQNFTDFDDVDTGDPELDFPKLRFKGWEDEEYNVVSECNIDRALNLVSEFTIDHNSIQYCIFGNDRYDEDIFLIDADDPIVPGIFSFTQTDFLGLGINFYNERLNNETTATRWLGAIPNSIALFLGDGNDGFNATRASTSSFTVLATLDQTFNSADFTNVISNPDGNYDGTDTFTAGLNGAYTFEVGYDIDTNWLGAAGGNALRVRTVYVFTRPSGTINYTHETQIPNNGGTASSVFAHSQVLYMETGDTVLVNIQFFNLNTVVDVEVDWNSASYFRTTATDTGGGIYQTYDPNQVKVVLHEFEYPLSKVAYDLINLQPDNYRKQIKFEYHEDEFSFGWQKLIDYSPARGKAKFTLRTSIDNL